MQRRTNHYLGMIALGLALALGLSVPGRARAQAHPEPAAAATGHETAAAPEGGHGGGAAASNPLKAEPTLAIWTLLVFLGVLGVLGKYAWKPLLTALHERERHLQHALDETERARSESEALLAEHRRQMSRAADEVRALLDQARRDAQVTAEGMIRQAQEEAEAARQRAQRDIAAARDQALAEIWQKTADMAVQTAGRVLATELSPDDHRRLLDAAIRELPASSVAGANGHGGAH